jgi:cytoplasmic FMR1 interacting protein
MLHIQGIKLLALYNTRVLEQTAFKYAYPVKHSHIPDNALSYELAVRYNYSSDDKQALIEYISIIKNLSNILYAVEKRHMEAIRSHIYKVYQSFVQLNVSDYVVQLSKKKRHSATYDLDLIS